jgi:hypothetical protein
MRTGDWCLAVTVCLWWSATAGAQDMRRPPPTEPDDHSIVFELGAAGDW